MKKTKLISGVFLHILSIIVLLAPLLVLIIAKRDTWFIEGADKVSIGFIISLVFALLLLKGAFKNIDKRVITLVALGVGLVVVWLLETIMNDLFYILLCSIIGYSLYCVVNFFAEREMKYVHAYEDESIRQQARLEIQENNKNTTNTTSYTTTTNGW